MEEKAMEVGAAVIAAFLVLLVAGFVLMGVLCVMCIREENRQAEQLTRIEQYMEREEQRYGIYE